MRCSVGLERFIEKLVLAGANLSLGTGAALISGCFFIGSTNPKGNAGELDQLSVSMGADQVAILSCGFAYSGGKRRTHDVAEGCG